MGTSGTLFIRRPLSGPAYGPFPPKVSETAFRSGFCDAGEIVAVAECYPPLLCPCDVGDQDVVRAWFWRTDDQPCFTASTSFAVRTVPATTIGSWPYRSAMRRIDSNGSGEFKGTSITLKTLSKRTSATGRASDGSNSRKIAIKGLVSNAFWIEIRTKSPQLARSRNAPWPQCRQVPGGSSCRLCEPFRFAEGAAVARPRVPPPLGLDPGVRGG